MMKKLAFVAALAFAGLTFFNGQHRPTPTPTPTPIRATPALAQPGAGDGVIADAFANHKSNVQVAGEGIVVKLLPDDNNGTRHQKFLVRLVSQQTLLIAHNIDLAPKIDGVRKGDAIQFYGEYEWSEKGGVIHWTHRDPRSRHEAGWLQHDGRKYQ